MKLNKLFKLLSILSLILVIIFLSCQAPASTGSGGGSSGGSSESDGDNKDAKELANGVYAKLIVARISTPISGITYKLDSLEAVFSKYYDSCNVESDLKPTSVFCSDANGINYDLTFTNNMYQYNDPTDIDGFLGLGLTHTFNIDGSAEVPDLSASIDLPDEEPTISNIMNNSVISKNNDLIVEWQGSSAGDVVLVLMSVANQDELISVETSDDGSYTFSAAEISLLSNGQYYLHVERFDEEFINAPGYDSRSIIRARLLYSILINLTD